MQQIAAGLLPRDKHLLVHTMSLFSHAPLKVHGGSLFLLCFPAMRPFPSGYWCVQLIVSIYYEGEKIAGAGAAHLNGLIDLQQVISDVRHLFSQDLVQLVEEIFPLLTIWQDQSCETHSSVTHKGTRKRMSQSVVQMKRILTIQRFF